MPTERLVEQALIREVADCGGVALKFVSPGWSGAPDRLILFPDGRLAFVEVKAPGKKPSLLQTKRLTQLRNLGFVAGYVDSATSVHEFVEEVLHP